MRVAYVSTDDISRPRNEIILEGLRELGYSTHCYSENAWKGIKDKSFATRWRDRLKVGLRYLAAYPKVLFSYACSKRHDLVIVPYMGIFDLFFVYPLAKIRREPLIWDAFISMYNTVVEDRKLLSPKHPLSRLLFHFERLACRLPDLILLDTQAHVDYFRQRYDIAEERIAAIPIGAKGVAFRNATPYIPRDTSPIKVLFFGTFIPLHGLDTVVEAATLTPPEEAHWIIVGRGQEDQRLEQRWNLSAMPNVTRIPWMEFEALLRCIDTEADVCLGIFGDTDKAARVVANKCYEVFARGRPLITRDSPAMRELIKADEEGLTLVPPADPAALAHAVRSWAKARRDVGKTELFLELRKMITPQAVACRFIEILSARALVAPSTVAVKSELSPS